MLYHVVAVSRNGVIGKDGKLPWHFSVDLKFFKNLTTGHTVIMGRKTFDSIGKPLPNRRNIVISRSAQTPVYGVEFVTGIEEAVKLAEKSDTFIIGGASVYKETLSRVDGVYLTRIDADYEGDTFYPGVPEMFRESSRQVLQENPRIEVVLYRLAGRRWHFGVALCYTKHYDYSGKNISLEGDWNEKLEGFYYSFDDFSDFSSIYFHGEWTGLFWKWGSK